MGFIELLHTVAASAALVVGGLAVAERKGSRRHLQMGRAYVVCMLSMNATALSIYNLWGVWGPFHYSALLSLSGLTLGMAPLWLGFRKGAGLRLHAIMMSWSYVGLLAAAAAEFVSRLPGIDFFWSVGLSSLAVVAVGGVLVHTRVPRTLESFAR